MLLYERKFSLCDLRATHIVLAWDKVRAFHPRPLCAFNNSAVS